MLIARLNNDIAKIQGLSNEDSARALTKVLLSHFKDKGITRTQACRISGVGETAMYKTIHPNTPRCMTVATLRALKDGTGLTDKQTDRFLYVKRPSPCEADNWPDIVRTQLSKLDICGTHLAKIAGVSPQTVDSYVKGYFNSARSCSIAKLKPYLNLSDQQEQQFTF